MLDTTITKRDQGACSRAYATHRSLCTDLGTKLQWHVVQIWWPAAAAGSTTSALRAPPCTALTACAL